MSKLESSIQPEDAVKDHYGKNVKSASDMKSGLCNYKPVKYPQYVVDIMKSIPDEIIKRTFSCGPVYPPAVDACHLLDLGSGTGRDCYILSKLVGDQGSVTGLDMTDEQLEVARKYVDYHTKLFGYSSPNVRFIKGNMDNLVKAGIESNTIDVIISNCVVNLAKDKRAVLKEAHRVLKDGGELYFGDVYADRQVPQAAKENKQLWCECVSGALYWRDLHKLAAEFGFSAPRIVAARIKDITNEGYRKVLGDVRFASVTYSLFKLPKQKPENKSVTYQGGIEGFENQLQFCNGITFKKGERARVDNELSVVLQSSRYRNYFTFDDGKDGICTCLKVDVDPFEAYASEYEGPGTAFPNCC